MLSSVPTASLSPRPKSQFPWSGTLIRLATGFCVSFASSSAVCAAAGKASASSIDNTLREILVAHAFIQVLFQRMSRRHQHSHPHVPINRPKWTAHMASVPATHGCCDLKIQRSVATPGVYGRGASTWLYVRGLVVDLMTRLHASAREE